MKSTQISPMFISLTETEEEKLCGGESLVVSKGAYINNVVKLKGEPGKKGVKKQTVQSSSVESTVKVVKTSKDVKIPELKALLSLFDLSSLLDW
ncbi:MAG: hypothetical protein V7L01_03955 [Nostoc sp.]|uniref:hypothetical protein n=1 Tax=Nostoc sp. TaxID=1180 RepID=UPI002FFB0D15